MPAVVETCTAVSSKLLANVGYHLSNTWTANTIDETLRKMLKHSIAPGSMHQHRLWLSLTVLVAGSLTPEWCIVHVLLPYILKTYETYAAGCVQPGN